MNNNPSGYVITAAISSIKDIVCDEVWQITRSSRNITGAIWMHALAPSPDLYKSFLYEWKDKPGEEWWPIYKELFEQELKAEDKLSALKRLQSLVKSGKVIALVCFCRDSRYSHRTLVGEYLKQHGIRVDEFIKEKSMNNDVEQLAFFKKIRRQMYCRD